MLKVLFFASVRERLDCAALDVEWDSTGMDLEQLQERLVADKGSVWGEVLGQDNMIRAVNQAVIAENCTLADGDEVAFFPPVTGG
jgi:molybdopterin synthase sulfur carrier subunit